MVVTDTLLPVLKVCRQNRHFFKDGIPMSPRGFSNIGYVCLAFGRVGRPEITEKPAISGVSVELNQLAAGWGIDVSYMK